MKLSRIASARSITRKALIGVVVSEEGLSDLEALLPELPLEGTPDLSGFKGKKDDSLFFHSRDGQPLLVIGAGAGDSLTADGLRNLGAQICDKAREKKWGEIAFVHVPMAGFSLRDQVLPVVEGIALANYRFAEYLSEKKKEKSPLIDKIQVLSTDSGIKKDLDRLAIVAENTHLCRDMVNRGTDHAGPEDVAREAQKLKKKKNVTCQVYGPKEIERMGMGLLHAVSMGSRRPPRFVLLTYRGAGKQDPFLALAGKGITFDSGGVNLKRTGHIETMRMDMAGAATVLYTFKAAVELGIRKNIYALLPLTENMLSRLSFLPGNVYRAYDGTTVEIGNTDAEGRLVLADAMAYAADKLKPAAIIDVATLTGACVVTFGETVAACMTTVDDMHESLTEASQSTGEKIWRLPFFEDYDDRMKSDIADISNMSTEKNAGTISAGVFLRHFTKDIPWAHLDIAGAAWYSKKRGYRPKHATGFGLRLLLEFVESWEG
jgi:leucyl aminopeptidase